MAPLSSQAENTFGGPFVQWRGTICIILVGHHKEQFFEIILNFGGNVI